MLTREYILSLQAGREMDALVAENVMRFTNIRFGRNDPSAVWVGDRRKFQPSTDISAAWEVVEKYHQVNVMRSTGWKEAYDARIWVGITGDQWSATAETAPLAICRAALLTTIQGVDNT